MLAILMAFLGPICHGFSNIIDAHIAGKIFKKLTTVIFYACLTNILAIPFVLFFGMPQNITLSVLPYIIIVSLIDVLYMFPYYTALKRMDTSIVAAMFSLGKIIVPVLAYFMVDEKLKTTQYIGFGLVILFSLFLNCKHNGRKFSVDLSFWLMLGVSLMLSVQSVVYKKILNELDWVSLVVYNTLLSDLFVFCFLFNKKSREDIIASFKVYKKRFKLFLFIEVFDQLGSVPGKFALSLMPVVVLKAINSTQPLFVLIYGIILFAIFGDKFKEDVCKGSVVRKTVCFIFIIVGVAMTIK